jgi:type VI secretion system protein ImpJ
MVTSVPGQKPPQKFVSFPLAQVTYQNEAFALGDFVPPSLAVNQQSSLARMCVEIARRAREKALFLAERAASPATADNSALVQEIQAEIRCLVSGLPKLEALVGVRVMHPFIVYLALCDLVGAFSIFSAGSVPPTLSHYDHNNCLAAFSEVRDFLLRMLDRVKETATPIQFTLENGKFGLAMDEAYLKRKLIVGVKAGQSMSEADVVGWMEQSLIASAAKIEKLWQMRIKGAGRRQIDASSELDITPGRGVYLFMIDNDAQFIQPGETLEIWNAESASARFRVAEIVLYA